MRLPDVKLRISELEKNQKDLQETSKTLKKQISVIEDELYTQKLCELHIEEINRLAELHMPRLQRRKDLSPNDILELDKWLGRAKTVDGLIAIRDALAEMTKYTPDNIKSNLYGLIQQIINGGAYSKKK